MDETLRDYKQIAVVNACGLGGSYLKFIAVYEEVIEIGSYITIADDDERLQRVIKVYTCEEFKELYPNTIVRQEVLGVLDKSISQTRIAKRKSALEIKKQLDAKVEEMDPLQFYELLSKASSEVKKLYTQYAKACKEHDFM